MEKSELTDFEYGKIQQTYQAIYEASTPSANFIAMKENGLNLKEESKYRYIKYLKALTLTLKNTKGIKPRKKRMTLINKILDSDIMPKINKSDVQKKGNANNFQRPSFLQ
jgi:hypothetical protein